MKAVRGIAGIAAGFGLFYALVRLIPAQPDSYPPAYMLLSVTCTVLAAMFSGFITALIAGSAEFPHAAALGLLMIAAGFISMRQSSARQPGWQEIAIAGCGPAAAMVGAATRLLTKRPKRT